jgi:hypothetical protein
MKTIYKKLAGLVIAVLAFSACTEDLVLEPISLVTNASFWKSADQAEGGLNGMYYRMRAQAATNFLLWGEARSEIWVQNFGFDPTNYYIFGNDFSRTKSGPDWTGMYSVIHDANLILKYVPDINFVIESDKNLILAQAHAMRAFLYFTMTKIWGDLIINEDPTEGFDPEKTFKERSPQSEVFQLIKKDIEDALALFPNNNYPARRCNWSKPAVNALKADVYLWTAKKLNGGTNDLNTALTAISQIETSDVTLLSDYESIFNYTNKGNKEIIMSVRFFEGESSTRLVLGGITGINAPSPEYTDAETMAKVTPMIGAKSTYWQIANDVVAQFSDDDQRKEVSLVQVFETKAGETKLLYNVDLKWDGTISGGILTSYDDLILYRYADIVLMKAEAKNALGQDPSEEINMIRKRAFGNNYSDHVFQSGTKEYNDEVILQERLLEFIHEGKRWWDLLRFNKALELVPLLEGKNENYLLFPINESILSLVPLIEQNPGYN